MKKGTLCLLLAMLMVLSIVLAGCSTTAETPAADETPATTEPAETTDNTETPEAPEETAEPALEQKTIQLMITGSGKQANSDKVWAQFNEQLQQYVPNTTVEFIDVSFDEYSEKFSQVLASGEGVDLAWTGWLINKPQNIADGNLIPLDDLLAEYGQGIVDILGENVLVHNNVVCRSYYHCRLRIPFEQSVRRVCDARGRIPSVRLEQQVFLAEFGQVFPDKFAEPVRSDHDYVFLRYYFGESFIRMSDERFSGIVYIEELLGPRYPAHRPETRTGASGHDYTVEISVGVHNLYKYRYKCFR